MRYSTLLVFVFAFIAPLLVVATGGLHKIAERNPQPGVGRWIVMRDAQPNELITFKILLKQQNLDKLEKTFWEVSDPTHANYGKFLTKEDIHALVGADTASVKLVLQWLHSNGISGSSVAVFSDYIAVHVNIEKASKLFDTEFSVYKSLKTGISKTRINGRAFVPAFLVPHIDFVTGIYELIDDTRISAKTHVTKPPKADPTINPSILQSYYQIPSSLRGSNPKSSQGIGAFTDYFSMGALQAFDQNFGITGVNVTREGSDCFPEQCDQYESDLDVQYITAIGRGIPTWFLTNGDGDWILDWAQALSARPSIPLINSISYGWAELEQCDITNDCSNGGYNSKSYVARTDQELQKLGTMGITILVSDGDDGAASLGGASGNCPIDINHYCPTGGCEHTSTSCPALTFTLTSNNTVCFFPMGLGSDSCQGILQDDNLNTALNAWAKANSKCDIAIDTDNGKNPHVYSSCDCSKLQSHSSKGYTISAYTYNQNAGAIFAADYPTSSAYVTSVGATQFVWGNNNNVTQEISASILTGAIITTGGGFSSFQAQPSYQSAVVASYLSSGVSLPPSYSYNGTMRAYPDIVFNGHNYLIYASTSKSDLDQCPCQSLPVDGTSCSSPALAGMLALINDQLLTAGKTQLGFVNPLLYQMAKATPAAFTDITSGSNNCNRAYCCLYGWSATAGWDPVGGLGSPVFPQFLKYVLSAKGVQTN